MKKMRRVRGAVKRSFLHRSLRHELLESRNLMAGDVIDSPSQTDLDLSSGFVDMSAALDFPGDVDVLRIEMGEFTSLSTGAWELDGGDSLRFRVLDAAGNEVAMPGASSSEDGTVASNWVTLYDEASGVYFLEISSVTGEAEEYALHVSAWNTLPMTFPDVTPRPDDADEISSDATVLDISEGYAWIDGELEGASDVDVFTFELATASATWISGSPYRVELGDFQISLYDADGNAYEVGEYSSNDLIEVPELEAGVYYVVVRDSSEETTGYSITVRTGFDNPVYSPDARSFDGDEKIETTVVDESEYQVIEILSDEVSILNDVDFPLATEDFEVSTLATIRMESMHNLVEPSDVNGDNELTPLDALIVINWLNRNGPAAISSIALPPAGQGLSARTSFFDTNNDGYLSPIDALIVVNRLNSRAAQQLWQPSVGEGNASQRGIESAAAVDLAFSSGDDDDDKEEEHPWFCVLPLTELV